MSLTIAGRFLRSSTTPSRYIRAPPSIATLIFGSSHCNAARVTITPANIARPPKRGIGL